MIRGALIYNNSKAYFEAGGADLKCVCCHVYKMFVLLFIAAYDIVWYIGPIYLFYTLLMVSDFTIENVEIFDSEIEMRNRLGSRHFILG